MLAIHTIQQREMEDFSLVYTDGSAEYVASLGWVGGWGCHSVDGWECASHLPPHTPQTINSAELQAFLKLSRTIMLAT